VVERAVLLLTRRGDTEMARVGSSLTRAGVPTYRLDADRLDGIDLSADPDAGTVRLAGHQFAPTVTWLRHFAARAATGPGSAERLMLYRDSWQALAGQLGVVSGMTVGGRAPALLEQQARATELGVRIPRTVVTTDPAAAAEWLVADRYVVKALHRHFVEPEPGRFAWFHPLATDGRGLRTGTPFAPAPVLLQEFVPHDRELRAYLVGHDVYGYDVRKSLPHDPWLRPERVRVSAAEVSAPVADAVCRLAACWDLRYAAFDFLLDGNEPVFLELDPQGDWRWFERAAGLDRVGAAAARMVCAAHRESAVDRTPGILTFLGFHPAAGQPKAATPPD